MLKTVQMITTPYVVIVSIYICIYIERLFQVKSFKGKQTSLNKEGSSVKFNHKSFTIDCFNASTCEKILTKLIVNRRVNNSMNNNHHNNNTSIATKSYGINNYYKECISNYKDLSPSDQQYDTQLLMPNNNNHNKSNFLFQTGNESTLQIEEHNITPNEEKQIRQLLTNHFRFNNFTEDVIGLILTDLFYFSYEKDKCIYEKDDEGNFFYILAKGEIKIEQSSSSSSTQNNKVKIIRGWDCFGELALMSRTKRDETVMTLTDVGIFCLDGENFRESLKRINETRLRERYNFLNTISIFQPLGNISKHSVAEKLKEVTYKQNDKIITYGTVGNSLYIIKNGLVSCRIGQKEIRKLGNNDYFGQNAILIDMKRSCDVVSIGQTIIYEISRDDLKDALGPGYVEVILFSFFENCIDNNKYFKEIFIETRMHDLFNCFRIKRYGYKEHLSLNVNTDGIVNAQQLEKNRRLIFVIDGSVYKTGNNNAELQFYVRKGDVIGEELFKKPSQQISAELIAYPDCITLESEVHVLCKILKITMLSETILRMSTKKQFNIYGRINKLKRVDLFKHLSVKTLEILANAMVKNKYSYKDIIVKEGSEGESFFLISKGRVRVSVKDKFIRDLESGSCFGEVVLLSSNTKRTATITAIEKKVTCYEISKTEFDKLITDKNIIDYMKKKLALQDTSIELKDLQLVKFLGKGKFGNVNLVHNNKYIYAIKAVSRKSVDKQKILARYFVNERRIMLALDHPFIIKMVKSLKNKDYCFFLMEFVNGINLDDYLSRRNSSKKKLEETKFYIACMLIILEYLQNKQIAHRDIKPSNIMISDNGYLKMIDFGTAKVLTDYTHTVIGTPHYISPEILLGKGYSLSCDFWSVGICMYEIFYGVFPFGEHANEVMEIYKDIVHQELMFPLNSASVVKVNAFIADLLKKKVNQRICSVQMLKKKPLFDGFDWDKIVDFKMTPPFIPKVKDYGNVFKIQKSFEECLMEEKEKEKEKDKEKDKGKKDNSEDVPGYNKKWADEF